MKSAEVVIAGAGLAGLSCAMDLAERGHDVLVLESKEVVGGRTASWTERGMAVESGLHRWLGFYKALPDLIGRAGVSLDDIVCWEDEVEIIVSDGGPRGVIGLAPFYKPLTTIGGFIGNNDLLPPRDKVALVNFFARGLKGYVRDRAALDEESVRGYARSHGVSEKTIQNLLAPLTAGIFFVPPERYSALAFFGLLAPGIPRLHRMRLGAFMGGMTEVMAAPIAAAIEARGGRVETGVEVNGLMGDATGITGVETSGGTITAQHVVLATGLEPAQRLVGAAFGDHEWFRPMCALPTMPAVTIQFELSAPLTDVDRTTFGPGTCWASFAEQSRTTFRHAPGRLSVILTPPEEFLDMPDEKILERVLADGERLGFALAAAMTDYRVVRFPADFYSLAPGHDRLRPPQETPVPGLTLAGDYTRQPLLASMEGAVISGQIAASVVDAARGGGAVPGEAGSTPTEESE